MSIASVTDRIQAIETKIDSLATYDATDAASAAAFGTELSSATTASTSALGRAVTGTIGTSGTTDASTAALQQQVVSTAESAVGTPYVWGGNSLTKGIDCSGLVQQAYQSIGIDLPRLSADQAKSGTAVDSLADAQPGDLLAWDNSSRNNGADHIAIYLGNGKMVEAPRTGLDVRIVDVPSTPDYIRRVIGTTAATGASTSARTDTSVSSALASLSGADSVATARSAYDLQALFSGVN